MDIMVLQEPTDLGLDDRKRIRIGFNLLAHKAASGTFIEEILSILVDAGVGVVGTNILYSSAVSIPAGAGPYLHVLETGGREPDHTHNSIATPAYQRPGAQIVVRAQTYAAARTMALNAYNALVGVRNRHIAP